MDYEQILSLVLTCPKLTQVNLYVGEHVRVLDPLKNLMKLQELKLWDCDFYADGVENLLNVQGDGLINLNLEFVDGMDMEALCCLAEKCPNLRKLELISCDFVENFGESLEDRIFSTKPFRMLQHLVCLSESAPNIIEFLLIHADKLQTVRFGSTAWFNDKTIEKVIGKGGLRQIQEIRILSSYEVTFKSVDMIFQHCPKLRILGDMETWEGINDEELRAFRQRLTAENIDLDTSDCWKVKL